MDITITWSTEDVTEFALELGKPLSEEESNQILLSLKKNHDSNVGINWDVIRTYIEEFKM